MNSTLNKIDELNYELTIQLSFEDYSEVERKKLSECRRKADFKGFRKGNVPASLVKRVYGKECLAEAVNQALNNAIDSEIKANDLKILGEPLTSDKQAELEWESGNDFTFVFDLGVSPEVNFELSKEDTLSAYNVSIDDEDKNRMVDNLKHYYEAMAKDNPDENTEEKKKSDEEIEKEAIDRLQQQYKNEADWKLNTDLKNFCIEKANVQLPEAFLKRWLIYANEGKLTKEKIEEEFDAFVIDFKWQMIRGYLGDKFDLNVDEKELYDFATEYIVNQYAMYGINNIPDNVLKEQAINILQNKEQAENLYENLFNKKVFSKLKELITINYTDITSTQFSALK